jgi:hypothetical protein
MRYLLLLTLLVGCAKSAAQKQREVDLCRLRYGTDQMATCLTAEYRWDSLDAAIAEAKQSNLEARYRR